MRINSYLAQATSLSRRKADEAIQNGRVILNGSVAKLGDQVTETDVVSIDGREVRLASTKTVMLNKPAGYVVSRDGQGAPTVYDLLPSEAYRLKAVGRLDKDSSGLLLLTNDGELAQNLTHPSHHKIKIYEVTLNKSLSPADERQIQEGVALEDGLSRLELSDFSTDHRSMTVTMYEGRNRQIRRTFAKIGMRVVRLHRVRFGDYELEDLPLGDIREVNRANK